MNLNIKEGRRCGPADAYLRPVMAHRNLTVLTEAPTVKPTLAGTRCAGVELLLDGELYSVGASREVILSAGTIHTPRPLLPPRVGPPGGPGAVGLDPVNGPPGVGRNLQDHLWIMGLCFESKHPLPAPTHNLAGSAGFCRSRPALDRPDLMLMPLQAPVVSDELAAEYPIPP